ncbi:IKI3 family protein [Wolffia australiana]
MKNLNLLLELCSELELQMEGETLLLSAFDVQQRRVFFASSANFIYNLSMNSSHEERTSMGHSLLSSQGEPLPLGYGDIITALYYQTEKEALIVGTSSGDLILYSVDYNTTEIVGKVDGGVQFLVSSPDGALLAVSTGLGRLLVMTYDWEVLYETEIVPQLTSDMHPENLDVINSCICWRGDGKYLATLSRLQKTTSSAKLKIWERDSGNLHAATETIPSTCSSLDWMPSGAKLACAYRRKNEDKSPSIVFYEKNGLERGSFNINEVVETKVETLGWDCSSTLLATLVTCHEFDAIKIWSFSNNHWYLKQEMRYLKADGVKFAWDPIKPLQLLCWTLGGKIKTFTFFWSTAVIDSSVAFVIDGSNVLVSPLDLALIPPPMSLFKLKFPCSVSEITCQSDNDEILVAALLCDGSLCVMELPSAQKWEQFESKTLISEASVCDLTLQSLRLLTWLDSYRLLGSVTSGGYCLQEIELIRGEDQWQVRNSKTLPLDGPAISVVKNPNQDDSAFIQLDGGHIYEYCSNSLSGNPALISQHSDDCFPSSCPWMKVVLLSDKRTGIIGLNDRGRLHLGKKIIYDNCTGFCLYSDSESLKRPQGISHLILTTRQDSMFILSMDQSLEQTPETIVNNTNKVAVWERGAKLVGVVHGDEAAVVLQAMRGNLECIYPRKLVLLAIMNALTQRRYADAMFMVRRHRIDFNFIVDYLGLSDFVESAGDFVSQVKNLSYITDFVCAVKEENVTETVYKQQSKGISPSDSNNKVSTVLSAVRKALEERIEGSPERELCVLTTLARSQPPALEEALGRIRKIRETELTDVDISTQKLSHPSAEDAVKHLLWLSDAEAVFEAALGLYDLNLAAIVALNSDKDPKEFLPYLESLERLPTMIMKYKIDLRLGKHETALRHIVKAGEDCHEEAMRLMQANPNLYPLGLELVNGPLKRKQVLEAWGGHLQEVKSYDAAATVFLCCSSHEKVLKAYRASGDWKGVMTVAGLLNYNQARTARLAAELCEELHAVGKSAAAAQIARDYCGDIAGCVGYLVAAREWEEALRIGHLHETKDLIAEVATAAAECCGMLVGEYDEGNEKVGKYVARYLAVRQRRLLLAAKLRSEARTAEHYDDDTVSEASSAFSGMSAYTASTVQGSAASATPSSIIRQRGSRRQKSGGKIRPGSPGEEMALVDHLKGMALTTTAEREVNSLTLSLIVLGNTRAAGQLQSAVVNFIRAHQAAVKLCEDASCTETLDPVTQTLDYYKGRVELSATSSFRSSLLGPLRETLI